MFYGYKLDFENVKVGDKVILENSGFDENLRLNQALSIGEVIKVSAQRFVTRYTHDGATYTSTNKKDNGDTYGHSWESGVRSRPVLAYDTPESRAEFNAKQDQYKADVTEKNRKLVVAKELTEQLRKHKLGGTIDGYGSFSAKFFLSEEQAKALVLLLTSDPANEVGIHDALAILQG